MFSPRRLSYLYHTSILNSRFCSSIFSIFNISNTGSRILKRIYSSLSLTFPRQHSVFYNDLNIMKVVIMILSEFLKSQTGKGSYFKTFLGIWKYLNKMLCICKEVALYQQGRPVKHSLTECLFDSRGMKNSENKTSLAVKFLCIRQLRYDCNVLFLLLTFIYFISFSLCSNSKTL